MAPRNRQYYGKKSAAQNKLAARCFAASSSPIQPEKKHEAQRAASTKHKPPISQSDTESESGSSKSDSEVENLLEGFGSLRITTGEQGQTSKEHFSPVSDDRVLHDLEINSIRRQSPRLKDKQEQKLSKDAPQSPKTTEQTLSLVQPLKQIPRASKQIDFRQLKHVHLEEISEPREARRSRQAHKSFQTGNNEADLHVQSLLSLCSADSDNKKAPIDFQTWSDSIATYFDLTKIAEASYGEVFRYSLKETNSSFTAADESVIKLIALKPDKAKLSTLTKAQRERVVLMSAPEDVANEVRLLKHMTRIPGFTNFRDLKIVRGRPASQFCAAWRHFNRHVKKSEFINPSHKNSYSENQLWAVVEMQDAGRDLEHTIAENVWMCWDVFWGVACALAKGEEWASFEHRDLHLGNVCVRWNDPENVTTEPGPITEDVRLGFTGLETTLIDYTLSRADLSNRPDESAPDIAYFDLSKDQSIFQGNGAEDYQYDIYRHMRSAIITGDPCKIATPSRSARPSFSTSHSDSSESGSDTTSSNIPAESALWSQFHPLTNLIWLHFVLHKLTESVSWPSSTLERNATRKLDLTRREKALDLERKILQLQKMLELEQLKDASFCSAGELVGWAINEEWLDLEDVVGTQSRKEDHMVIANVRKTGRRLKRGNGTTTK